MVLYMSSFNKSLFSANFYTYYSIFALLHKPNLRVFCLSYVLTLERQDGFMNAISLEIIPISYFYNFLQLLITI
jgi:hypothetical protein